MAASTLKYFAVVALLALATCQPVAMQTSSAGDAPAPDISGWRLASGKAPTQAEFAALVATCEAKGAAFDSCLSELGLKHAQ
jgi:hypothetical protein